MPSDDDAKETLMKRLVDAVKDSMGEDVKLHQKSMFGGICCWIDGTPKTGFMIGGVTSKLQVSDVENRDGDGAMGMELF